MKVYFIRHAEPDYSNDSLTEKGWREAALLAERLKRLPNAHYYVSPMGRAKDTASLTLEQVSGEAEVLPWLHEFEGLCMVPGTGTSESASARYPRCWANDPLCYDFQQWQHSSLYEGGNAYDEYLKVSDGIDALLEKHGYVREGGLYRVVHANKDNLVLFCHGIVTTVILAHMMQVSPVILWHLMIAPPSSVTILSSEEREEGIAIFRMNCYGDCAHLVASGEPVSPKGRFQEVFLE